MDFINNGKESFYEHLGPILNCAQKFYDTKKAKGIMCKNAGIEPQRWSEFVSGKKKFTAYYVWKILQSINLSTREYEEAARVKFTNEQRKELKYQKFVDNKKGLIIRMMEDPEFLKAVEGLEDPDILNLNVRLLKKT